MNKPTSTTNLIESDELREFVLEKEAVILAEILEVKRKRAQMIKEAKEKPTVKVYKDSLERELQNIQNQLKAIDQKF